MKADFPQRVLVAEDSAVISNVIKMNLEKAGFEVEVAENGKIAAERLDAEPFDLLLTDYQMPEMDGDELCRRLRQSPLNDEIPIIMVSAKGFELDVPALTAELGIAKFVYKPFSPRNIIQTVNQVLATVSI